MYSVRVSRNGHQERTEWMPYSDAARIAEIMRDKQGVTRITLESLDEILDAEYEARAKYYELENNPNWDGR